MCEGEEEMPSALLCTASISSAPQSPQAYPIKKTLPRIRPHPSTPHPSTSSPRVEQVLVRHVVDADAQVGGGAEVDELEAPRRRRGDGVLRLEVAVHDARRVAVAQRLDELAQRELGREQAALGALGEAQLTAEEQRLEVVGEAGLALLLGVVWS